MINLICKRENKEGLLLEIINNNIELNNLILELVFEIKFFNFLYENIFDLNIHNLNKGPRLEINNDGCLSLIYNLSNDPSKLYVYVICKKIHISTIYSLKIIFYSDPYNMKVILNNISTDYKLDNINKNLFNTNGICISGGFNDTRNFINGKLYTFNLYTNSNLCEYGILMPFDKIQNFYNNIISNGDSNKISKLILENNKSKNISNILMSEKYYSNRDIVNDCRIYIENYNYIFTLNILLNKCKNIKCFLSNENCELIFSENINTNSEFDKCYNRVYYFKNCINNSYFMIFTAWEFNIPYFVYYTDTNILYNICVDETSTNCSNHISHQVNNYILNKLNNKLKSSNLINYYDSIHYGLGHIPNLGHYFWQEILGLIFLIKNNLINNIKNIVIGPYDYLGFKDLLKKKYEFINIIDGSNFEYSNCIMTTLNCTYMSNTNIEDFKNIYFENYNSVDYKSNSKVITFIIRNGLSRNVENNFEIIYETILYFLNKYKTFNFIFYITGWFLYDNVKNLETNNILHIQNNFINNIINKIHINYPNCDIENMIGINIHKILNLFKITDFLYDETGSSSMFATPIFNFKSIWSTTLPFYDVFLNQNNLLNTKNKIIPIPKKYICMKNNNNSCTINKNGYLDVLDRIDHFNNINDLSKPISILYIFKPIHFFFFCLSF